MNLTGRMLTVALALAVRIAAAGGDDRPPGPPSGARTIFSCKIAGVRTFSDRPCGLAAQSSSASSAPSTESGTMELGPSNILKSPARAAASSSARTGKPPPRAAVAPRQRAVAGRTSKADGCGQIRQSLRKITSKMRSGYTAKEGERLRERKKDLEEKRRAGSC